MRLDFLLQGSASFSSEALGALARTLGPSCLNPHPQKHPYPHTPPYRALQGKEPNISMLVCVYVCCSRPWLSQFGSSWRRRTRKVSELSVRVPIAPPMFVDLAVRGPFRFPALVLPWFAGCQKAPPRGLVRGLCPWRFRLRIVFHSCWLDRPRRPARCPTGCSACEPYCWVYPRGPLA